MPEANAGPRLGDITSPRMKIALVCPYNLERPGGVRSHIAGLGTELVRLGHEIEVVAPGTVRRLDSLPVIPCGRARRLPFSGTQIDLTWASWSEVRAVCARGYDVMHFHTIWNPLVPFQLAARFRGRKVATFHDVPGPETPAFAAGLMWPASELIRRLALDRVIAVSPSVASYLSDGTYDTIPNGLAIPDAFPAEGAREAVLYLGRLEPRKGIHTLLEAAALLGPSGPPIWIAGDGYLRADLERFAQSRGLSNVQFFGEVTEAEKWRLLRGAGLFVAPSLGGESFGIVLLEAMAAGAPPIAADNPGYADLLRAQPSLLYSVGSAEHLASKIRTLLGDAEQRSRLREWGERYARLFDWRAIAPRIEAVYRGVDPS